jgi:hypothetical protein
MIRQMGRLTESAGLKTQKMHIHQQRRVVLL